MRITRHVIERFAARTDSRYYHLTDCRELERSCQRCAKLRRGIRLIEKELELEIKAAVKRGVEEKSFLNDALFMASQYEKYGYDHVYSVFFDGQTRMCFVTVQGNGERTVLTCFAPTGRYSHLVGKSRYAKAESDGLVQVGATRATPTRCYRGRKLKVNKSLQAVDVDPELLDSVLMSMENTGKKNGVSKWK